MKKLMLMAAAVCSAVVVQAASFTWTSANYSYIAKSDGTRITSETDYTSLMNGGSIVLVYLGTGTADWSKAKVLASDTISGTTGTIYTSSPASKKGLVTSSFKFSYDDDTTIRNGAIFGVMYQDKTGALSKLVYTSDDSEIDSTYTVSGLTDDTWSGDKFTFTTAGTSATASNNFTTAVPEPTSGLLLLLGMAGLALKRKIA